MIPMKQAHVAVIGLGYVGLTIAAAFAKNQPVTGFDISDKRIHDLKLGYDKNNELSEAELKNPNLNYTTHLEDLVKANFFILTVLTPIDSEHRPDLSILLKATEMIGKILKRGDIVVYESTIFPGGTEEYCIPLLEKTSGLKCGKDFGVGYSPERINPCDKEHTLNNIPKIISASDEHILSIIMSVYKNIVKNLYPVSKIAIAEAAKVIENTQRDLNISIMNEFSLLLHKLNLDSKEVFDAARTKWNFVRFQPGLVGGHCIGVNTYYLTHRAEQVGFYPELLLAGRRINEFIPDFIVNNTIKELIKLDVNIKGARIAVLGLTYKENMPDLHDSKAWKIIEELKSYQTEVFIHDDIADPKQIPAMYQLHLTKLSELKNMDAVIITVPHQEYVNLDKKSYLKMFNRKGLIVDVKGFLNSQDFKSSSITLWRL